MGDDHNNNIKKKPKLCADSDSKMTDIEPFKYECPVPYCERKYRREMTLLTHVLTDHREIYNKIMNIVNEKESVKKICDSERDKRPEANTATVQQETNNATDSEAKKNTVIVRRKDNNQSKNTPTSSTVVSNTCDTKTFVLNHIKQSPYYHLQVNETVDITNCPYVMVICRYKLRNSIQEDLLFVQKCSTNTTAVEIMYKIFDFITTGGLMANKWIGISMDGVRAATISLKIIMEFIKQKGLDIKLTYSFTRRAEFIMQHLPATLKTVLDEALQYINVQKTHDPDKFCTGMDNTSKQIFLQTDQYWLSYGNVLTHLFDLRETFSDHMIDSDWLCRLAYLADLFEHFNRFYSNVNENISSIFHVYSEFEIMIDTLKMDYDHFCCYAIPKPYRNLRLFTEKSSITISPNTLVAIQQSLIILSNNLYKYLPVAENEIQSCEWIVNPFKFNIYDVPANLVENATEYGELMDLRKNLQLKFSYKYEKIELFWVEAFEAYPNISKRALQYLLIFKNTRFCEAEFGKLIVADSTVLL